jgi:hypothetical protein
VEPGSIRDLDHRGARGYFGGESLGIHSGASADKGRCKRLPSSTSPNGDLDLRLFIMTFCRPQDVTVQELRIETFFPADPESERCWQQNFAGCAAQD